MKCPRCNNECNALVLETRKQDDAIVRKRSCGFCGKSFFTQEVPVLDLQLHRQRPDKVVARANIEPGQKSINLDAFKAWR